MKKYYTSLFTIVFCFQYSWTQGVGVNTDGSAPDASALLDIKASDKGLLVPRINLTDVTSASPVTTPATGLLVYNTNASVVGGSGTGFYYWNGSQWVRLDVSNSGDWRLTGNSGTSPSTNFLGTTDAQDLVIRTNNLERVRILSGGNIGIGTSSPLNLLHVAGAANTTLARFTVPSGWGQIIVASGSTIVDLGATSSEVFMGSNSNHPLLFRTNATERARITIDGDMGLGTTTPTHRLHVNGAVRAESGFLANDGTAGVPAYRFTSDTDVGMFRPAANQIGFALDGIEKVRINGSAADALVGINNNSPSAPLDFVRTTSNSMLVGTNYGNAPNYDFRRAQGTPSAPTLIGANGVLARLRAFGYDGSAFQTAAQIAFEVDAASGTGDMPGRIVFSTTPDGSATLAERMTINNAGTIRFHTYTGNGVLVTSASNGTIQEVAPGAAGNILVSSGTAWTSGTGAGQFIQNQNATDQTANFRISGTGRANTSFQSPLYTRADAGTVAIRPFSNSTTAIQLQNSGGTSILNVDATNNRIGINNTTPVAPLDVSPPSTDIAAGVFRTSGGQSWGRTLTLATQSASGDDPVLNFSYRNGAKTWGIGGFNSTQSGYLAGIGIWEDGGDGVFGSGFGTARLFVAPGGNVGIGTTTPGNLLHVSRPSSGGNWAALQVTSPGDNSWGHVAVLRTTGVGNDGARLLFHSRGIKNWSIGGQESTNNFGIWEDGGDGVFGSGFGTQRLRIVPGGEIFGRFRHVTYHGFSNSSWSGNPANAVQWFPCPGGDGCDDTRIGGTGTPGNDFRREWVAPYSGRIVRVIVRVGNDSGSNPEFRGRICRSFNGVHALMNTTADGANENAWVSFECTQNNTFNRGDRIAVGIDMNCSPCYFEDTNYFVTIIWDFDIWD
jgi:hypothetical protein